MSRYNNVNSFSIYKNNNIMNSQEIGKIYDDKIRYLIKSNKIPSSHNMTIHMNINTYKNFLEIFGCASIETSDSMRRFEMNSQLRPTNTEKRYKNAHVFIDSKISNNNIIIR